MPQVTHFSANDSIDDMLAVLEEDAAFILDGALTREQLDAIKAEIAPFVSEGDSGRDEFAGFKTKRIGALMARSPACRDLALDAHVNDVASRFLHPHCDGYQLHFTQAVSIGPGEGGQELHRDRSVWGKYVPRSIETQLSTIWAITDFTAENGATRIIPGSHKWEQGRKPQPDEVVAAEMKAGSVLIYTGTVVHGGGSNQTNDPRLGVLLHYTLNWLRQEENQYLSCPPELARELSPELRSLMGYTQAGYVLGFYSDPVPPGEGQEIAPPERLFGDKPGAHRFHTQDPTGEGHRTP
ncbi:MAG: phytanoyl-CoA dioxygenase family protein [Parvularculaceae bacterium]|nr:phytanoyl-CoA dioxygenase family protein [Parvularculaceae bacterium]